MDTVWTRPGENEATRDDTARHYTDVFPQVSGMFRHWPPYRATGFGRSTTSTSRTPRRRPDLDLSATSGCLRLPAHGPRATALGVEAYPSLELKAAALLHSLVRNHALVDGSLRLAWLATVVFLDVNGHPTGLDDDTVFDLVMAAAAGHNEVEAIAQRLTSEH